MGTFGAECENRLPLWAGGALSSVCRNSDPNILIEPIGWIEIIFRHIEHY
jgi:hypothetical protein